MPLTVDFCQPDFFQPGVDEQPGCAYHSAAEFEGQRQHDGPPVSSGELDVWMVTLAFQCGARQAG